ncbi:heptaprenyl diphosphate synthase [Virgibacillus natechei]|uniref:Heptaprenyl diphosphate synthase n=1 Tax=Virgibacillus natechei TaxID=1216297 RepID=A0ABS4IFA0_9BACI|nr:heptaprenyl diphosphate synthase component 1 [Virgibacillus natechei]MBP1969613.1 heptaprenyl diphosphate synthase [Virgibacillus natechei]UZD11344.1 heptaprenyl diphosphate synthase component 1 [Virgibacillus natechei]
MNTPSIEIRHLKALVEDKIRHAYLEKYMQKPIIDEEKLTILAAIINNTALAANQKERYIITTMLVQVALDTHELVPKTNNSDESEELKLSKQLSVLAGDYYSGLYYLLLSEIEDFDLIHNLASAIKEINESKMKLYYSKESSFHEYTNLVKEIESILILKVAKYVDDTSLDYVASEWLLTNKLIQEKRKLVNNESSSFVDNWLRNTSQDSYTSTLNTIETIIEDKLQQLERSKLNLPVQYTAIKAHLDSRLNEYIRENISIAEEG